MGSPLLPRILRKGVVVKGLKFGWAKLRNEIPSKLTIDRRLRQHAEYVSI